MVNEILHTKRTLRVWLYYRLSRDEAHADIRLLVNKIVVSEQNGKISIQIKLNAKFINHTLTCDDEGSVMTGNKSSQVSAKKGHTQW